MDTNYASISVSRLYVLTSLARCPLCSVLNASEVLYSGADARVQGEISAAVCHAGDIRFVFDGTVSFTNDESAVSITGTVRPDFFQERFAVPFTAYLPDFLLRGYVDWDDVKYLDAMVSALCVAATEAIAGQETAIALERNFTALGLLSPQNKGDEPGPQDFATETLDRPGL